MEVEKFIAQQFLLDGDILSVEKYGNGLINKTFIVITNKENYVLQKINNYVFKNVNLLMENIYFVTKYIKKKRGNTIDIIKTKKGGLVYNYKNDYYRVYKMKRSSISYEEMPYSGLAIRMGKAIGRFQYDLVDIDQSKINKTIPYFHDLRHRYIDLVKSFRNCYDLSKKKEVLSLFNKIMKEYNEVMFLPSLFNNNIIKERICHYDTKLNNFLFSKYDDCLIDLDTVMPGCSLYDYGDCARNIIFNVREDSLKDDIVLDDKIFCYLTCGYLSVGKNYLTKEEIDNLVNSIKVITLELSIRFLSDYLDGDLYFSVSDDKQNLRRALCQFNLYKKILQEKNKLERLVLKIYKRLTIIN